MTRDEFIAGYLERQRIVDATTSIDPNHWLAVRDLADFLYGASGVASPMDAELTLAIERIRGKVDFYVRRRSNHSIVIKQADARLILAAMAARKSGSRSE